MGVLPTLYVIDWQVGGGGGGSLLQIGVRTAQTRDLRRV